MPTIEKLSIALPVEMATVVRNAVDAGEYSSQSEVVRDALRDWSYKRSLRTQNLQGLRQAWQEAIADDSEGEDPDPVLDALERKYDALAEALGQ
jgi:antitoxin ParD1/3/4